ncbi:hypothetical protein D4R87_02445 [bacterium]|nr:MAG: hypothetical protein D4R87_02445 [bacterium]
MATPITHIVLTEKVFDKFFGDKTRRDFFIGTLFPDIRYLKVIKRAETHFNGLSINDLQNEESFFAGLKFHSILDVTRDKFVIENDIYSLCPESQYIKPALKALEGELLYSHIKDWNVYINYLDEILPAEKNYGIAEKDLKKWHSVLQEYFQRKPDPESIIKFTLGINYPKEVADEINKIVALIRKNKKIIEMIEKLYNDFESLIV